MKRGEDGAAVKIPRRSKPARDFGNRKRLLLLSRATRLIRLPTASTFPKREGKSQKRPLCPQSEKTKNHRQSFIRFKVRESLCSSPLFINFCLWVIFRFLLSAIHRLSTQVLYLKIVFSRDTATLYRFNKSLLVCAPLRGAVLFTDSYSDIR